MMAGNLQAALAHALVDDDVRTSLGRDPVAFQRRFALTDEQMAQLRNVDARRLALTAQVSRAKRLDFLRR